MGGNAPDTRRRMKAGTLILAPALLLAFLVVSSAGLGFVRLGYADVARIVWAQVTGAEQLPAGLEEVHRVIVTEVRLPRILTAAVVGGGLATSGAVFQGILLNPLADPYTLGVSAGAAFGAAVAMLLNLADAGKFSVPVFAFLGAVITLGAVIFMAASSGGMSSSNLILSGIIVAAILQAGISFLKYVADEQVSVIIFWLMGSFASRTWWDAGLTAAVTAAGFAVFLLHSRELNLMALGDRSAASLGVDTRRTTLILLVTASMVTAVCVSVSGIIGFVGLLVPHMMRLVTGPDNRLLLPVVLLTGAALLVSADTLTRAVLPTEIPIGVLTALIGGPFFCYVFRKRQKSLA